MDRRQFIVAASTTSAIALTGCLHGGGGGSGADTSSPTAIVESYYEALDDLDPDSSGEDILDELDAFYHPQSPIYDLIEEGAGNESSGDTQQRSLASVSTEVTDENLGKEALDQRFGLSFFGADEEAMNAFAEENAVVRATIEYEEADGNEQEHLTATEGGDWQMVL